jgi:cytochrome c2
MTMPAICPHFSSPTARRCRETRDRSREGSRRSREGASLYGESFCASCHAVQNAAGNMVGGNVGPELTRVGSKVKPEWLQAWLRNPRNYDPRTGMPHYRFNDGQVVTLSGFLLAKSDSDLLANVHLARQRPSRSRTASVWFRITAVPRATKSPASRSRRTSLPN